MYHHSHTNIIATQYERDLKKLVRRSNRSRRKFSNLRQKLVVMLASLKS